MNAPQSRAGACTGAGDELAPDASNPQAEAVAACFQSLAFMSHELAELLIQFDGNAPGVLTAAHALAARIGATSDTMAVRFGGLATRGAVGSPLGVAWLDLSPHLVGGRGAAR